MGFKVSFEQFLASSFMVFEGENGDFKLKCELFLFAVILQFK